MSKRRIRTPEKVTHPSPGRIIIGGIVGLIFTVILTFAAAIMISMEMLPLQSSGWLGPVIIAASAFCAAFLSSRRNDKKIICGLLSALLYTSAMMVSGLLLFTTPIKAGRLGISLTATLVGMLGGVLLSGTGE